MTNLQPGLGLEAPGWSGIFFLILEGIRVLLCPWLRSIGGIRDSSYSDLSQYETRVMAQMVKNPPALQETWFNP